MRTRWSAGLLAVNHGLAVVIGLTLAVGEIIRSWGAGRYWASWLDDLILGAFLLFGAWRSATGRGRLPLAAAWGFSCGMLYGSFFRHWATRGLPDPGNVPHLCVLAVVAFGFWGSVLGMLMTLWAPPSES